MKPRLTLFFLLLLMGFTTINAQNIEVKIAGMRSTSWQIHIKIFKDDQSFKDDKEYRKLSYIKDGALNGEMTVKFNLEPGVYGFALLDDESNNGHMDYNFIGLPDEGFGFSNFYLTGLNRPKFDLFKLTVKPDQAQKVLMKIRYLWGMGLQLQFCFISFLPHRHIEHIRKASAWGGWKHYVSYVSMWFNKWFTL